MAERKLFLAAGARGAGVAHPPDKGEAGKAPRPLNFTRSGPYFAAMFLVALVAFWPSYLSKAPAESSAYTHVHAFLAASWMVMMAAQPVLIRTRRLAWHRLVGRASYVLAPLFVVSVVLLGHSRIKGATGEAFAIQTYVLYLQTSLTVLFALSYALAIATRRVVALHARFMACTALTMIDPVVIRLLFWVEPAPGWNYQWLTFGLTDLTLVALVWLGRHGRAGRKVFPAMLLMFVLAQLPALLGLTAAPPWQAFARWFAALPLT